MKHLALACALLLSACSNLQFFFPAQSHLDPTAAGPDYRLQGEYASADPAFGAQVIALGDPAFGAQVIALGDPAFGAQVIALGDGAFEAALFRGGLPGDGWDTTPVVRVAGARDGRVARFRSEAASFEVTGDRLEGSLAGGGALRMERVERRSPTLGAPPPPGATLVFDGSEASRVEGHVDADGHLKAGATSLDAFGDAELHVEFRTPFTPGGRGQFRGNSGVYLQDRYEVQVLDSFGLPGADDDCGGIYQVATPQMNMSYPPLRWQTYDITFRAARFDDGGEKTAPARITVRHNGVPIHDDVEIPGPTGGGSAEAATPGPLYLQDHWDPVVYRNVWVLER